MHSLLFLNIGNLHNLLVGKYAFDKLKCKEITNNQSQFVGITTCVDYSDFLEETIIHNKLHFDRYVVITTPQDIKT